MIERAKLKISCRTVDCGDDLHCYRVTAREAARLTRIRNSRLVSQGSGEQPSLVQKGPIRECKECGVALVDWDRLHNMSVADIDHTIDALRTEWIRHHFWHRKIDRAALAFVFLHGRINIRGKLRKLLRSRVGRAATRFDGRQTPIDKESDPRNVLYFAQHATGSCCRECIQGWYNIPKDRSLSDEELEYICEVGMRFIVDRLPCLPDEGGTSPPSDIDLGTLEVSQFAPRVKRVPRKPTHD